MKNVAFDKRQIYDVEYMYTFMQQHERTQWDGGEKFALLGLMEICGNLSPESAQTKKSKIIRLLKDRVRKCIHQSTAKNVS